jgi:hypothetical protein
VTNATGIATGLNADRVDSKDAAEIVAEAVKAAQAAQVLSSFAQVAADGRLATSRGVASARRTGLGAYEVVFETDVSRCALTATQSTTTDGGAVAVSLGGDKKTAAAVTRSGGTEGTIQGVTITTTQVVDRPFHIVATC